MYFETVLNDTAVQVRRVGVALILAVVGAQTFAGASTVPRHPTFAELREEITNADLVIRGQVLELVRVRTEQRPDVDAIIRVDRVYKGRMPAVDPHVRIEILSRSKLLLDLESAADLKDQLPKVGEELFLAIHLVHPRDGAPPPAGQDLHYMAPFFYRVGADGVVRGATPFAADLQAHAGVDRFEALILDWVQRPDPSPRYVHGEVLLVDDFDDGSLAGWMFLEGTQDPTPWGSENWISTTYVKRYGDDPDIPMQRHPETGLFYLKHADRQTMSEFGIVNGRLRLRTSRVLQHITAVIGDPQWTDYQIDVDMFTFADPTNPQERAGNYLKFGPYGRVHVPNLPQTQGEHSFVAVEVGTFGNADQAQGTLDKSAIQIRGKYPESPVISRDSGRVYRTTRILDFDGWKFEDGKKIHLTARFFGRHVEGWIDGKKVLEGQIPPDHPGAAQGRIALWTFETWVEYDNLRVTRLVAAQ